MDTETLIGVLNYSKTLIQDGEIKFIFYQNLLTHPDDFGKAQQEILTFREQELRDAPKSDNPDGLRKAILKNIEEEKKYGTFRESNENFTFVEVDLVFQIPPGFTFHTREIDYRMSGVSQFENYPSLDFKRFFNAGGVSIYFVDADRILSIGPPNQFANGKRKGFLLQGPREEQLSVYNASKIPPFHLIDEERAEVSMPEGTGTQGIAIITHFPIEGREEVMVKVYVYIGKIPKVMREEYYYKSESPNADANGFWLRTAIEYSDFEESEELNLVIPKLRDEKEYRFDGFIQRRTVITIKEMDFNLGLPSNFFDWDESELSDDNGNPIKVPMIKKGSND